MAAEFAAVTSKTLQRAEKRGALTPIRRGFRGIAYDRAEFLAFIGLNPARMKKAMRNKAA
jgi:hypothetical protein